MAFDAFEANGNAGALLGQKKKRHISPTVPQIVCCLWLSRPMASLWPSRDVYSEEQKKNGICCFSASVLLLSKNSTAIAVHMGEQAFSVSYAPIAPEKCTPIILYLEHIIRI